MAKLTAEERKEMEDRLAADDAEEEDDDDGGVEVAILRGPGVHSFLEKLIGEPKKKSTKKDDDAESKDKKPPSSSRWFS